MRRLPNAITFARLLLVPVFGWAIVAGKAALAPSLLVALALSDWLDGYLARRYRAESRLGTMLDPVADKLAQLTGLVLLVWAPHRVFTAIPGALLSLVLMREMLLLYGAVRVRLRCGAVHVKPRLEGKVSTGAIFLLLLAACLGAPEWAVWTLCGAGAPFVLVSGVRYVIDGHRQMKGGAPGAAPAGATGGGRPR
ncbi:MAG TPA: CDP-alcohol phosphatidyltransferase family protein [Planctomycetota bacterium]|nr:CDP-alcohol phosphatidyltransferase family protein [Planctomycetota bacterium]